MKTLDYQSRVISNRYAESERYVRDFDRVNSGQIILDAGAGEQRSRFFINNNSYISQDFGEYKGGGVPFDYKGTWNRPWNTADCDLLCDICDMPIEDNSVDMVICFEVIEHLPEPLKALKELARIIKPNGTLVITAPNLCAAHQKPYFYYSGFSKEFFTEAIPEKCAELLLQSISVENDFVSAHCYELKQLIASQNNGIARFAMFMLTNFTKAVFSLARAIPGFNQPESCSGFFVLYKKIT